MALNLCFGEFNFGGYVRVLPQYMILAMSNFGESSPIRQNFLPPKLPAIRYYTRNMKREEMHASLSHSLLVTCHKSLSHSSGVILYAMVCGRLPFGDDTKVKTLLKTDLIFTRPISTG